MSEIERFIKGKSKSFKYYLQLLWLNLTNKEEEINRDWVGVKLKSSYFPALFPKKGGENAIYNYLETVYTGRNFKRK